MLRAVDYLRVSTAKQAKGYGISYSSKETASYIRGKAWEHVGTFADEGVSGALESHQRPQLRVLMAAARAVPRTFDIVVVNEGRVIGRTGRAFWRWVWELQDLGIFVAVVKRDYDNSTPDGESKMRKDADYAEDERDNIRERTQGGIQEKAEEGGYVGGNVPYGYRIVGRGRTGRATWSPTSAAPARSANRHTRRASCAGDGPCTWLYVTGVRWRPCSTPRAVPDETAGHGVASICAGRYSNRDSWRRGRPSAAQGR